MKRIIFILLFFATLFTPNAFAQALPPAKDTTVTIVGDAELPNFTPGPLPTNPTGSAAVAYWSNIMASDLEKGAEGRYTRLPSPLTNTANGVTVGNGRYVCTTFVIASHRLAGKAVPRNSLVRYMQPNWESATGGRLINYTANNRLISLVRPGDVFFQRIYGDEPDGFGTGSGHVSIVYAINVDENGDGEMITREANASKTSITIKFQNWKMFSYDWSGFEVFLFGLQP